MNDMITTESKPKQSRHLDPGEKILVPVSFTDDGQPCPYYIPKSLYFKRLAAFETMSTDLKECIVIAAYLRNNNSDSIPDIVKSSLSFAVQVKYAKCFTKAAAKVIKIDLEQAFSNELSSVKDTHIEAPRLQELYLAATGKSEFRSGSMVITLNPDYKDLVMVSEDDNAIRSVTFGPDPSLDVFPDPEDFLMLYYSLMEYLEGQKKIVLQSLMTEIGRIPKREMFEKGMIAVSK